ncbi:uncharacterized protein EV422DRAFT_249913 [Fimicolochytrium jonesii]|uniref:uncharacterized protein n=1 Tax=Fimicolochytrium jonesii TaxID=1396493 RepID=UPI0022FF079B|nr:uncharacterized protein EV422DRAFT_249913 [Fimicolochytrium jonesii]KAI8825211.1 hypothetical protein EV422DRAFT_249913 [Fimicolochytrium jonesii]
MTFPQVDAVLHWLSAASTTNTSSLDKPSALKATATATATSDGRTVIITDEVRAEGGFLLNHFLSRHLRADDQEWKVVLVGVAQTLGHYGAVGKKLGLNIAAYQQTGKLTFIDALSGLSGKRSPLARDETHVLRDLFTNIEAASHTSSGVHPHKLCLVIDDISAFSYCGIQANQTAAFITNCLKLVSQTNGCFVGLLHDANALEKDLPDLSRLSKAILHKADYVLHVRMLESGATQGVDGQVSFCRGPLLSRDVPFHPEVLHYQITDAHVQFFKKGFSKGLL